MSGPTRLASPNTFRLVAASAAAVASLGVVALGVQLGTHGLVGDGPGRNPGSATATPAAAVVDARAAAAPSVVGLDDGTIAAVSPSVGGGFGLSVGPGGGSAGGATVAEPAAPSDGGGTTGGGAGPTGSVPQVPPTPEAPAVTIPPAPAPTVPPLLEPIVAPVVDVLTDAAASATGTDTTQQQAPADSTTTGSTDGTLTGIVNSLLGG